MSVKDLLGAKGGAAVISIPEHITVLAAAERLRLEGIGALVVASDGVMVEGIISERDIIWGLAQFGPEMTREPVSRMMARQTWTTRPDASLKDVMRLMTLHRIRHLPVVEDGRLREIISIGDVVKQRLHEMELEAGVLHDWALAHR
ncbi:MAG: CBS domain-containing protein [Aestuariivirgaceae bacterium]|nr:CBS domain-containing protein [Aestuariivirgaceae bacterium]